MSERSVTEARAELMAHCPCEFMGRDLDLFEAAILAAQPGRSASDGVGDALSRALLQWEMYADATRGTDENPYLADAGDPEARLYQECVRVRDAALATPPPAPDGEREGMKRQEWPEPCCYLNHELEQPCGLPPAEVVFTQTMTGPPTPAAADRPEPHPCFCQHGYGCDSYGRREPVSPDPTPDAAVSVSALVEALQFWASSDPVADPHRALTSDAPLEDLTRRGWGNLLAILRDHGILAHAAARDTGARGEVVHFAPDVTDFMRCCGKWAGDVEAAGESMSYDRGIVTCAGGYYTEPTPPTTGAPAAGREP